MRIQAWDEDQVLDIFQKLKFNKYIQRFHLKENIAATDSIGSDESSFPEIQPITDYRERVSQIKKQQKLFYYLGTKESDVEENIIPKQIDSIYFYDETTNTIYYKVFSTIEEFISNFAQIFEDDTIAKYGYDLREDIILLNQIGVKITNIYYDIKIAAYLLNPTKTKYTIETLSQEYLGLSMEEWAASRTNQNNFCKPK